MTTPQDAIGTDPSLRAMGERRPPPATPAWRALRVMTLVVLASCGGGGGSEGPGTADPVLRGTAAVGKPISQGDLALTCAEGTRTARTGTDGRYQVDLSGLVLPCLVVVRNGLVDGASSPWVLASAVSAYGVGNVTPWTHWVTARALGADPAKPGYVPAAGDLVARLADGPLADAKDAVSTQLARLLGAPPAGTLDAVTTAFTATAGNGMDELLLQLMSGLRFAAKTMSQATAEMIAGALQIKDVPGTCRPAVLTGFTGRLDDVPVQVPYDPTASSGDGASESGGIGDGAGGGEGAGTGGALGQFLGALVRVERDDGSLMGEAQTDDTLGLVTIVPCRYQGPLHIVIRGKADGSSRYYDESTRQYAPFPADAALHAAVPSLDKNVGVTILTEAAWQYLLARPGWGGPDAWKSAAQSAEANETIRREFNRLLPSALQVADITRLPVILNERSAAASIDDTDNGRYGIVNAGLARAAGLLLAGQTGTALTIARQLGADLCDGTLDYLCQGRSVLGPGELPAYLIPQLGEAVNTGVGDIASNCGNASAEAASFRITQMKVATDLPQLTNLFRYIERTPVFLLRNDGKVFFWPTRAMAPQAYMPDLTFRQLFASGPLLGTTTDGRAWRAPLTLGGTSAADAFAIAQPAVEVAAYRGVNSVAEVDETFSSAFAMVSRLADGRAWVETDGRFGSPIGSPVDSGLGNIVRLGVARGGAGSPGYYAVTIDGGLFAWGDNAGGQLGLGSTYDQLSNQPTPALVRFPAGVRIASVSGRMFGALATDTQGEVWGWGATVVEGLSQAASTSPVKLSVLDAFKPMAQVECAAFWQCAALSKAGELVVWGYFGSGDTLNATPVTRVPLPAGRKASFIGAAGLMVYGLLDDGTLVLFPGDATAPQLVQPSLLPANVNANCSGPR